MHFINYVEIYSLLQLFAYIYATDAKKIVDQKDNLSYNNLSSIWVMGLLHDIDNPMRICDMKKHITSHRMFWNEKLFDKMAWIVEPKTKSHELSKRYPYPSIYTMENNEKEGNINQEKWNIFEKLSKSKTGVHRGAGYEMQQ